MSRAAPKQPTGQQPQSQSRTSAAKHLGTAVGLRRGCNRGTGTSHTRLHVTSQWFCAQDQRISRHEQAQSASLQPRARCFLPPSLAHRHPPRQQAPDRPATMPPSTPPHIAIIGAGITGLTLAAGLQARNIPSFTVYERASGRGAHGSGGAGIGLSPNAERAMALLSPGVRDAYERVANPNGEDYFQWVDGLSREVVFKLFVGEGCFRGCRRADLLEELMGCIPEGRVRYGKALREVVGREGGEGVRLLFEDGTEEVADAGG